MEGRQGRQQEARTRVRAAINAAMETATLRDDSASLPRPSRHRVPRVPPDGDFGILPRHAAGQTRPVLPAAADGGMEHLCWRTCSQPEFRIARAVASMVGQMKQRDGKYSKALPMLGSLLPLKPGPSGWFLPRRARALRSQAVWTGTEVCHDLAAVLGRRYLDSLTDERPALVSRSVRRWRTCWRSFVGSWMTNSSPAGLRPSALSAGS